MMKYHGKPLPVVLRLLLKCTVPEVKVETIVGNETVVQVVPTSAKQAEISHSATQHLQLIGDQLAAAQEPKFEGMSERLSAIELRLSGIESMLQTIVLSGGFQPPTAINRQTDV